MIDLLRSGLGWLFGRILVEWPGRRKGIQQLTRELEANGASEAEQIGQFEDTGENRAIVRHVICIERWGQRRIEVLFGEPLVMDESDEYLPPQDTPLAELLRIFKQTRARTLKLGRRMQEDESVQSAASPHNDFGPLSGAGWLFYLRYHSGKELANLD